MHSVTCDKALFVSIKYEYNALDFSSKWHLVAAEPNRGICIGLPPVTERNYNLMARLEDENKKFFIQSGWSQFITQKRKMVSDFSIFKEMSDNRPTETDKGRYAEALFRDWLVQFLPAKYGVTSGYIIQQMDTVKPRSALKGKLRHYDVIIYNRLDSPVLWTEISPDHSMSGRIRAIPAEYVHGVLEVKSTFNAKNIADAFKKLNELAPLLGIDDINEPYKQYIPSDFYMGMIFFELPKKEQGKLQLLNKLMPANFLKGFFGGIILSAEGLDQRKTGRFRYIPVGSSPLSIAKVKGRTLISVEGDIWSDSIEVSPGEHIVCMFGWSESNFSLFAFDLINVMNGTYRPDIVSSWHGLTLSLESNS